MGEDWDERLKGLDGHFLQSQAWLKFQESLDQQLFFEKTDEYLWGGYKVNGRLGITYLYVPYGPTVRDERGLANALKSIRAKAKESGCMFARFDLAGGYGEELLRRNDCVYFGEVQPRYTHIINLADELATVKSRMSKTDRNLVNRSEKLEIEYGISDDHKMIDMFLDLMLGTAQYKNYSAKSRTYLEKQLKFLLEAKVAKIYWAKYEGNVIAGVVGVDWNGTRYYIHAGANQEVIRKIPASRGMAWYMIKDAKALGLDYFDFYGVSPLEEKSHKWASVSSFKRSFGGDDKDFGGTWDMPLGVSYKLYKAVKKLTEGL